MTATKVDGHAVIADEPAASPLRGGITFTRIRRLLLDDESVVHGCARMTDDRNEWKARALKAERAMGTLRKALGVES